ncbi:hypothetical protein SYNPS1DRAFT_30574 [Syncephalis pseudoplumigaleata]|uniref:Uncharacterized protein n=1 Tax=Syncephalis pseudoplumigaleata TaxID=1712513 RepID=A0A4P9YW39_9FUNG|nr:hypothetical protein SYNPS1DRAFT_30574 [Syncephalis pseudoplumigaleata]|eukprot:RKP23672.1 hypothetical protein SYNPS1DRAFT_30574 [Syncephalis pseudoplumigaleata]
MMGLRFISQQPQLASNARPRSRSGPSPAQAQSSPQSISQQQRPSHPLPPHSRPLISAAPVSTGNHAMWSRAAVEPGRPAIAMAHHALPSLGQAASSAPGNPGLTHNLNQLAAATATATATQSSPIDTSSTNATSVLFQQFITAIMEGQLKPILLEDTAAYILSLARLQHTLLEQCLARLSDQQLSTLHQFYHQLASNAQSFMDTSLSAVAGKSFAA